ncbi:MAG: hypothetical protein JJU02_04800 [Cryomorphaceae bacterium]|nr:hypothetical protein [Cryomorphaceae bacterium]
MEKWVKKNRYWLLASVIFIAYTVGNALYSPRPIFADALRGIEILRYSELFGSFNQMFFPNPHQPDELLSVFVAWWTPGQYQWLYVFVQLTNDLGLASFLAAIVALIIGTIGWIRLWQKCGFSNMWFLVFVVMLNANYYWHFLMYIGGDVLLFAVLPYFIQSALFHKKFWIWLPFWLVLGFWAKASFVVFAIPIVMVHFWSKKFYISTYLKLTPTICIGIALYYFYLNNGATPTGTEDLEGYYNLPQRWWNGMIYMLATPLAVHFWGWSVIEKLWISQHISEWQVYLLFLLLAAIGWFLLRKLNWQKPYYRMAISTFIFVAIFFSLQQVKMAAISFESRHFYPLALIFLPLIFEGVRKQVYQRIYFVFIFITLILGIVDASRFTLLAKSHTQQHIIHNNITLPLKDVPEIPIPNDVILVTDIWEYTCALPNHSHKLALEVLGEDHQGYLFRVLHGIESDDRPEFRHLGDSKKEIIGVFFRLSKSEVSQLLKNRSFTLLSETESYFMIQTHPN